MVMSDHSLPGDLEEEILCRVPTISLKRLRSTCKRWNALFKDQAFTKKHLRKATKQSLVLAFKQKRVCSMSINLNVPALSAEFKDLHSRSEEQFDIADVFHCDGLFLCTTKDKRLVVWNPCSGETKWIPTNYKILNRIWYFRFTLGYRNNNSCPSYKILRYIDDQTLESEIYEFSSDTWRVLDDIYPNFSLLKYDSVSLKGNSYGLASGYDGNFLLCFDFSTEKFKHMCLPSLEDPTGNMALSVVREEQLSVLHTHHSFNNTSKMEIWVTNKFDIEAVLLWSKFFTVESHIIGHWFEIPTSFLIDQEKREALCCTSNHLFGSKVYIIGEGDENHKEVSYVKYQSKDWWWLAIFSYVPSLVQIQQGRGQIKE